MPKLTHEVANAVVEDTAAVRVALCAPCLDMILTVLDRLGAE